MSIINRENILVCFLAFVLFYFGYNEITSPDNWVRMVPAFLNAGEMAKTLVLIHGGILVLAGLSLLFNFHRKTVALIVGLMLLEIIVNLIMTNNGLNATAVRDIGLFGMALAIYVRN